MKWLLQANIDTAHIDSGKSWQNGSNQSFNGKFRDECLNMEWFRNRIDAKIVIEQFCRQYNEVRPHSSLGQLTKKDGRSVAAGSTRSRLTEADYGDGEFSRQFATNSRLFSVRKRRYFLHTDVTSIDPGKRGTKQWSRCRCRCIRFTPVHGSLWLTKANSL